MTQEEKIEVVKTLLENNEKATDTLIGVLLDKAGSSIKLKMYPFTAPEDFTVPSDYEYLQCDLAVRYFNRMGGEGEVAHSENGIARNYNSANDSDLLAEVMQVIV